MAISTDARIRFFGTRDSLDDGSTSAVASTAYSVLADITAWTNDDDAEKAVIDLAIAFSTAPTAGELVLLYMRKINFNGTNDEETPSDDVQGAYVGSISVDNIGSSTVQYFAVEIDLVAAKSSQEYEFYFKNDTGQSIDAGWTADITPIAPGPHA
jgi:hypothetical protein